MKARVVDGRRADVEELIRSVANQEVRKQLREFDEKHEDEIDAIVLYILHEHFGFGKDRLRRFYDEFSKEFEALGRRYSFDKDDSIWLCTKKLKEYGINLDIWKKERKQTS